MEKNISTHTKGISQEDMATWVEAITEGTVEGKEIDKETAKKLDRIGSRSVSLEEATRIAKVINAVSAQETTSAFNEAFNLIDLLMIILEDEVGVTEEQVSRAQKTLKEKREAYLKDKQEELRQKQQEETKEETESDSNEKVIQLKKNDEQ
ncbi:hypothetical protein SRWNGXVU_CDS0138 [Staphylococcus phage PG-2021_16]|nr:hypothetical protein KMSP1_190 [Staphylococcus phage KMSP1]